jgi:hypothetical protein
VTLCAPALQSNCEWVGGDSSARSRSAYDFRAVSDYSPTRVELTFSDANLTPTSTSRFIVITNDQVCWGVACLLFPG